MCSGCVDCSCNTKYLTLIDSKSRNAEAVVFSSISNIYEYMDVNNYDTVALIEFKDGLENQIKNKAVSEINQGIVEHENGFIAGYDEPNQDSAEGRIKRLIIV